MKKRTFNRKVVVVLGGVGAFLALLFSGCVTAQAQGGAVKGDVSAPISSAAVLVKPNVPTISDPLPIPENYPVSATPEVSAKAVIVMDPTTREIIFKKNIHEKRAVASTQKLLTAIVAMESAGGKMVKVPVEATKLEPSKLYLRTGAEYQMDYLLKALMVKSANDVAYTIAHGTAGSFNGFIEMMNARASRLGMSNSHFKNASGLTLEGQYSTAYDIALCASVAYQNPYIRECIKTQKMTFNHVDGRVKSLENTNELLKTVPYCTGMKTGTTKASGYCLVSSGELNGRTMIVGVFGASSKSALWKDSEALLRWSLER